MLKLELLKGIPSTTINGLFSPVIEPTPLKVILAEPPKDEEEAVTCTPATFPESEEIAPVSYTHLDVYKRQNCFWIIWISINLIKILTATCK